ncbi:MAG: hypothetical protein SchgKO_16360 [Schleiferiaceae bacterium]
MSNLKHYHPSLQVDFKREILSWTTYVLLALIVSYTYSLLTFFVPIIYLNFLICMGTGLLMGTLFKLGARPFHNRNPKRQRLQALVISLLMWYFQWVAFVQFLTIGEFPSPQEWVSGIFFFGLPQNVMLVLTDMYEFGYWSVGDVMIKQWGLLVVWGIELLMLVGIPVLMMVRTKSLPYSETQNQWFPKYTLRKNFKSTGALLQLEKDLAENPLLALQELGAGSAAMHIKVHVFSLPHETVHYISVDRIRIEGQGRGKRNVETAIPHLEISSSQASKVLENFDHKRERWDFI